MTPYLPLEIISNIISKSVKDCRPSQTELLQERNKTLCCFTLVNSSWRTLALEELVKIVGIQEHTINGFLTLLEKESTLARRVKWIDNYCQEVNIVKLPALSQLSRMSPQYVNTKFCITDADGVITPGLFWPSSVRRLNVGHDGEHLFQFNFTLPFTFLRQLAIGATYLPTFFRDSTLFPLLDTLSVSIGVSESRDSFSELDFIAHQITTLQVLEYSTDDRFPFVTYKSFSNVKKFSSLAIDGILGFLQNSPSKLTLIHFVFVHHDEDEEKDTQLGDLIDLGVVSELSSVPAIAYSNLKEFTVLVCESACLYIQELLDDLHYSFPDSVEFTGIASDYSASWSEDLELLEELDE